ncbi:MAG TPA: hypothetical protein PLA25_12985, partial [Anaerolineaceae bacterium]|nr:hypothetical protein [Anaerolineaceae bacterium]
SGGIEGTSRWLRRVWSAVVDTAPMAAPDPALVRQLRRKVHQTLRSVTRDYQAFEFNTIVSSLMELMNEMLRVKSAGLEQPCLERSR